MIQMKKKKKEMEDMGKYASGKQEFKPVISPAASPQHSPSGFSAGEQLTATLESRVSLGSGEYFMDVLVGTPPRHYSLILDTGSDLNWIQCVPCYDCFEQNGPHYNPRESTRRNQICGANREQGSDLWVSNFTLFVRIKKNSTLFGVGFSYSGEVLFSLLPRVIPSICLCRGTVGPTGNATADDNYFMGNFSIDSGVIYLIEHGSF
ncbi:hypothetical protein RHGRI_014041 [Rhododendron griersonianum]|uniref:Peptidase A1 domain-containing protein n=1 Tax=Rhododendron griersonianum TaxID=479676 RepID=A0AAV6K7X0_9ERIC|nr:hypothetical protein RHGRI_014041 [Rhododendron griersonianum]